MWRDQKLTWGHTVTEMNWRFLSIKTSDWFAWVIDSREGLDSQLYCCIEQLYWFSNFYKGVNVWISLQLRIGDVKIQTVLFKSNYRVSVKELLLESQLICYNDVHFDNRSCWENYSVDSSMNEDWRLQIIKLKRTRRWMVQSNKTINLFSLLFLMMIENKANSFQNQIVIIRATCG